MEQLETQREITRKGSFQLIEVTYEDGDIDYVIQDGMMEIRVMTGITEFEAISAFDQYVASLRGDIF